MVHHCSVLDLSDFSRTYGTNRFFLTASYDTTMIHNNIAPESWCYT